jgi:crossover junction endodeoxyribonuclease RuvC
MIIFGIDPGTATTGYGIIKSVKSKSKFDIELLNYGCIVTPKEHEMPLRLYSIQKELKRLLRQFKPDCVIVEQLFFGINSRTAMSVGQARGVVLSTAASYRLPIFEYQGLHVKYTLTGSGRADKKQIQKSVMKYLGKRKLKKPVNGYLDDAADALAVAICHAIKIAKHSTVESKSVKN